MKGRPVFEPKPLLNDGCGVEETVILRPDVGPELVEGISRDASVLIAPSRLFQENSGQRARTGPIKSEVFREVLRPNIGLRMTVVIHAKLHFGILQLAVKVDALKERRGLCGTVK